MFTVSKDVWLGDRTALVYIDDSNGDTYCQIKYKLSDPNGETEARKRAQYICDCLNVVEMIRRYE